MAQLKFEMYLDHPSRNTTGVVSKFTDETGRESESVWTGPPKSIDHVDLYYLQDRLNNVCSHQHEAFVKQQYKLEMKNFSYDKETNSYVDRRDVKQSSKIKNQREVHSLIKEKDYWKNLCEDLSKKNLELEEAKEPLSIEEWHEDDGDCLWWEFPIEEPPYCGTPLDVNFPDYATHFTRLILPNKPD